jgi:glycosyltransferase involved in cell wall biosynthesis
MKIFIIPKNHEYIRTLEQHLEGADVQVVILKPFHYSSLVNLVKMVFFRMRGCRIIHVHWLYVFPFPFVMKGFYYLCKGLGIKIVWEMHNILPHGHTEKDRTASTWFYEHVDAIIFHSRHDIQRAKELLGTDRDKPHVVIPHGNFNESYENRVSKSEARKKLELPQEARVILCFGFIRENRGYEYLLTAVENMGTTVVVIAGKLLDKDVYIALRDHARKSTQVRLFAKWIADEEIQYYFNACDIVVLPYTDITTSGVIPLAYAFSRPVISTDIGGIKDIVNPDIGILVPPKNAEALQQAIQTLFLKDVEAMGKRARVYAEQEFSWEANVRKIKGLYETLTG